MSIVPLQRGAVEPATQYFSKESAEKLNLLEVAVFDEFLNSALLTATTTSIANAILENVIPREDRRIACYLPPTPGLFPEGRLRLCTNQRSYALSARLSDYYDRLQLLRSLMTSVMRLEAWEGETCGYDAESVALSWRQLAAEALAAIEEFACARGSWTAECVERRDIVVDLLVRAQAGDAPCVDDHGRIRLPAWAERRGHGRAVRNLKAFFLVGDGFQGASVVNVSEKGLGVVGLRDVGIGVRVSLLIKPGSSIDGRVVWVSGDRVGIELDTKLPQGCHLLAHFH